jgi:hypothetical protein
MRGVSGRGRNRDAAGEAEPGGDRLRDADVRGGVRPEVERGVWRRGGGRDLVAGAAEQGTGLGETFRECLETALVGRLVGLRTGQRLGGGGEIPGDLGRRPPQGRGGMPLVSDRLINKKY